MTGAEYLKASIAERLQIVAADLVDAAGTVWSAEIDLPIERIKRVIARDVIRGDQQPL